MNKRKYYETEIANILKKQELEDVKVSEYYRNKTIMCLLSISNAEHLQKIYRYTLMYC